MLAFRIFLVLAHEALHNGLGHQAIYFISNAQQVHGDIIDTLEEIKKRNRSLLS